MTVSSGFDPNGVFNLIGLWDFKHGAETKDTGLADGVAQNGQFIGGAYASGGQAKFDGCDDRFDVSGQDTPFDLTSGVIELTYRQDSQVGHDADTLVSRGEYCDKATEGYFGVSILKTGAIQVIHDANGKEGLLTTASGLVHPCDDVKITYSWDAATGAKLVVENLTTGATQTLSHSVTGLDMDIGDNDNQSFTFGARESDDGQFDQYFDGSIDYVAVYQDEPKPMGDGIVEGTAGDDVIDVAYTGDPEGDRIDNGDAILPGEGPDDDIVDAGAGNDKVIAGAGDDTVYAGSGNDYVEGGAGNDVIYGDSNLPGGTAPRESFEWDKAPDPNGPAPIDNGDDLSGGFTQNTGSVNVTYSVLHESSGVDTEFTNQDLNVDGIDTDGAPADDNSGLFSDLNGKTNSAKYQLAFSQAVTAVSFNINDIDGDGVVRVKAWDLNGNPITVNLVGGSKLTLLDTDTVAGSDTADSLGGYADPDAAAYNLQVSIAGPVSKIIIEHSQNGSNNSGIIVTDVYFTPTVVDAGPDGNDTLLGGEGDDIIYGEGGNDTLRGGSGNDILDGGEGDNTMDGGSGDDIITGGSGKDTITGGSGNDTVDGGAGDDHIDTSGPNNSALPDRGFPSYNGLPAIPADADPNNDRDTVYGGDGNDTILTGDDEDYIDGGTGNDKIDGGLDDDTILGGSGDDYIIGGEGSDSIDGGDGNDTIYGGLGPVLPDALNIRDDGSDGPADPVTDNGMDVIHGGAGNDKIYGQDDDDTLYGDEGDDYLDGGIDDDTLYGGTGNDHLVGGQGDDRLDGGAGNDLMEGGDDRDTFVNVNAGDTVHGGAGFSLDPSGDFDTLDLTGSAGTGTLKVNITGLDSDGNGFDGTVDYFDAGGNLSGSLTFTNIESVVPCFTPGTMIATPKGERAVETLAVGDRIITRDNGIQSIRWIGTRTLQGAELAAHLMPVRIRKGALGNGLPERDMLVSPNHRILVASDKTALYFEESEVLVAAKHLTGLEGVDVVSAEDVTYIHFMFDQHEVVLSNGSWTESFQPGDQTLKGLRNAQRNEIYELFPELKTRRGLAAYQSARRSLKRHEAALLVH